MSLAKRRSPSKPRIELLYFEGCPNHEGATEIVRRVMRASGIDADVVLVDVPDAQAAEGMRFLGSPTIRIDGRDVERGADQRTQFQYACRVYRTELGFRGQPEERWVRDALRAAAERRATRTQARD